MNITELDAIARMEVGEDIHARYRWLLRFGCLNHHSVVAGFDRYPPSYATMPPKPLKPSVLIPGEAD